ncbi:MAG: hypothetical protein JJE50_12590, partial [Actinomycetales bacterium]|nr:hypothetical protein [Actinomycetales bacterium]
MSQLLLERWLVARNGWTRETAATYAVVPGSHHGVTPDRPTLADDEDRWYLIGAGQTWDEIHDELAAFAVSVAGAADDLSRWAQQPLSPRAQVLVTGTIILADWIASNDGLFPYDDVTPRAARARRAWDDLDLPGAWLPAEPPTEPNLHLAARFDLPTGSAIRPLQAAALDVARSVTTPGLMIIEGPMGIGKTEAALLAAEVFA